MQLKITRLVQRLLPAVLVLGLLAMTLPAPVNAAAEETIAAAATTPASSSKTLHVKAINVVANKTATFEGTNFPDDTVFYVRVGPYKTYAREHVTVGKVTSGKGGTFTFTIKLPELVRDIDECTIRLDSKVGHYYAFNLFHNKTGGTVTPTPVITTTPTPGTGFACQITSTSPSSAIKVKTAFDAKWVVKNTGSKSWSKNNVDLKYVSGKKMQTGGSLYDLATTVNSGGSITLIVDMKSPSAAGTYTAQWELVSGKTVVCVLPLTVSVHN